MENTKYIEELTGYLSNLTADELADVIDFYNEYILDADLTTDEEIIAQLGNPKQLSRKILADYSIKATNDETAGTPHYEPKPKKNIRMIWLVILAIFAAPIALPLAIAIIGVISGLLVVIFAVVASVFIIIISFFAAGITAVVAGLSIWSQSVATAGLFIGSGLAIFGLSLIALPISYLVVKVLIQMTANFSKFLYNRFVTSKNTTKEAK